MGTLGYGRAACRAAGMALLATGLLVPAGCGGGEDTSADTTTSTTVDDATTGETTRTTVATTTTFDLEGTAENLDVVAQAACLGVSTGRTAPEDAAVTLYNLITGYQDDGATGKDLKSLDTLVTLSLVDHCGPEIAGQIDKVRLALDD